MERLMRSITLLTGVLATPLPAWAQERPWDGWGMHPLWGAWGISMMVIMFVFWALIIAGLVLGIR